MTKELIFTDVGQAYHEHEILLTGATGFLGKVLMALLLDRFPGARRLHLLLRRGRHTSAEERFESEVLRSPALEPLIQKLGLDFVRGRVSVWEGDMARPGCDLEQAAIERMARRVGLIINCAGQVEFSPPLDEAFAANVDGVEHVVKLARTLGSRLLHVSTCYVAGEHDGLVEETEPIVGFYPRRWDASDRSFDIRQEIDDCRKGIGQICESAGEGGTRAADKANIPGRPVKPSAATTRLIAFGRERAGHWGWVNAHTYSKSLGEQIIAAEINLDYAIVRPAMIESALRFPFPGWIERGQISAPLVPLAREDLRRWPVRPDIPLEVVPVDLVAAAILVIGAELIEGQHRRVYQLATADVNPFELGSLVMLLDSWARQRAQMNGDGIGLWSPALRFLDLFIGAQPGGPVRFVSAEELRRRRQRVEVRLDRAQRWVSAAREALESKALPGVRSLGELGQALESLRLKACSREQMLDPFLPFLLDNRYIFECENIRAAYANIPLRERELLPWDPERIEWERYWMETQIRGLKKWAGRSQGG